MAKQTGSIDLRPFKEAGEKAAATNQYFWYKDGTDTEAGAHVTEIPQTEFQPNPSGGNLLLQSNSIKIRRALTTLVEITTDGLTIFDNTVSIAEFGRNGFRMGRVSPTTVDVETYDNGSDTGLVLAHNGSHIGGLFAGQYPTAGLTMTRLQMLSGGANGQGEVTTDDDAVSIAYVDVINNRTGKIEVKKGTNKGNTHIDTDNLQVSTSGAITATGKATFGALANGMFALETHQAFASASIAGGGHKYSTVSFTKANYYPLAIAGWNAPDATFLPSRIRLSAQSTGSATVAYDVYNPKSSAASSKFNVDILWLKVSV